MKTKNNVQKTALRTATLFVAFLVAVLLQASGTSNYIKSTTETAYLTKQIADDNTVMKNLMLSEAALFHQFVAVTDKPMEIEPWMTNDKLFNAASAALAPAPEPNLEIEGWMLDENNFSPRIKTEVTPVSEKKIELWKVNDEKYGRRKFILTQIKDRKLNIERWMLVNNYW